MPPNTVQSVQKLQVSKDKCMEQYFVLFYVILPTENTQLCQLLLYNAVHVCIQMCT